MTAQRADELVFGQVLPIGTPEERALAQAFKSGERDAYRAIHERYEARVHSVCRRMLHNPEDAAEAAQETFLRVYQGLGQFNGRYRLGAWVVRIATNVCLDQLRASTRRPSEPTPSELLDLESAPVEGNDPEILFMRYAEGRKVRKILESLPPMHRAAIVLRDFEGISYAEIAETLGITDCQVKALLHRARRGFRKHWTANFASVFAPFVALKRLFRPVKAEATQHMGPAPQAAEGAVAASSQQVTSVAAQAFQTCSGMIQGCGQFFADKAAPVVTAVVVGTATVGAAAIRDRDQKAEAPIVQHQIASALETRADERERQPLSQPSEKVVAPAPPQPAVGEEEPVMLPPVADPVDEEPAPSDSGTEAPPDSLGIDPQPPPQPEPPPPPVIAEPEGFDFAFGLDMASTSSPCDCLFDTSVESSSIGVSDSGLKQLDHVVTGSATAAGTPSYGLWLRQRSNSGFNHDVDFNLQTNQGSYTYTAAGHLAERSTTEWGGWVYRYEGTYKISGRPTMNEDMPERGTYASEIVVSWRQGRIVKTNLTLTER